MADTFRILVSAETQPEALAAFLATAEYAILQAPQGSDEDASEALISAGCWYAPRLLAAVEAALRHHQPGKLPWCGTCGPQHQPYQEVADIRRALLGEGETDA